jgi:hypothetical protein
LDSSNPPVHPSAPLDYPHHRFIPVLPWTHPSHRSIPVLPWTIQATSTFQCSIGLIQATGPSQCSLGLSKPSVHPSAPLDSSKPPQYFLDSTTSLVYPSAPWNQPSHRPPQCFLESSKPLVGVVLFHCTFLQCSLHFCTYTLAMQSMVSAFIQHYSRYIIE